MAIKDELQSYVFERLGTTASPLFLGRVRTVLNEAANDRAGLAAAAEKVGKLISLFIDKGMGKEISGKLTEKIDREFS